MAAQPKIYPAEELRALLDAHRERFYTSLPYVVENYSRFKLIPFVYGKDLAAAFDGAFKSLQELIAANCTPFEEKEKNYDYGVASTPLIERDALFLREIVRYDNLIDKKSIERWFVPGCRQFLKMLKDVFLGISKESENKDADLFLFMLTLSAKFAEVRQSMVSANTGRISTERKDAYYAAFFSLFTALVADYLGEEMKGGDWRETLLIDEFSPLVYLDMKTSVLRTPFNTWSLGKGVWEACERGDAYGRYGGIDGAAVLSAPDQRAEAVQNITACAVRDEIFDFVARFFCSDELLKKLAALCYNPTILFNFLRDAGARNDAFDLRRDSSFRQRKELAREWEGLRDRVEKNIKWRPGRDELREALDESLRRYVRFKNSEAFAAYHRELLKNIKDRRKDQGIDLRKEYEEGRLYYFSGEKARFIKTAASSESAALFIDIREFSKKTFHLKEEVIIEFLREKFYQPVLRFAGTRKAAGDIVLNNIVGDAIIFTGSIEEILGLALIVKKNSDDYKRGLEHLIEDESKKELMAVDLGMFIAYGRRPSMTTISSEFGNHLIAIGEIINEASRGAKRDGGAFRRLQYLMELEGRRRGTTVRSPFNVHIVEGYNIVIPPTLETNLLRLTADDERREAIGNFFEQAQLEMRVESGLGEKVWTRQKHIYNIGIAFTGEALAAYLNAQKLFSDITDATVDADRLPPERRHDFFFKDRMIELKVVQNRNSGDTLLFRKEGTIDFKGLCRETEVWELMTRDMELFPDILRLAEQPQTPNKP